MNVWDEIAGIRADLSTIDQTVAQLTARLRQVEIHQRSLDRATGIETNAPPPLPAYIRVVPPKAPAKPAPISSQLPPASEVYKPPAAPPAAIVATETSPTPVSAAVPARPMAAPKPRRRFGPPKGMSFEEALGTYWFPRIGVPIIAMSVVFFFTYAANQFRDAAWMPYARVGAGFALASTLLGIGWKLEKKYATYARVVMGGGFGVLYFVLFATWYIPQTRIAPSQEFALVLLALLVAGWGAIAQWRQSRIVALFMTFMGHFTVALSTLTLESPSRAAIGGLLLLGAGSAWFLYRNGWYLVALAALAGSYLNQFLWLARSPGGGTAPEFVAGMAVLATYLLLFAIAERATPAVFAGPRHRVRNVYCGMNTGGFLLLALALLRGFDFARPFDYLLYFSTALFAAVMGAAYTGRRHAAFADSEAGGEVADPLSAIYFTKASALMAVGLAAWLDGPTLTLTLTLQALVLLLAARQSGRPVGRLLALGTAAVAFVHGVYTWQAGGFPIYGDPGYVGHGLVLLATVAVFGVLSEVYRVAPWHHHAIRPFRGPAFLAPLARDLELCGAPEIAAPQPSRMTLSHLLAGFGVVLYLGHTDQMLAPQYTGPLTAVLAVSLIALGLWRRAVPFLTSAVFLSGVSALWWLHHLYGAERAADYALTYGGVLILALLASAEAVRLWVPWRLQAYALHDDVQGSWQRNPVLMANVYSAAAALLTLLTAHAVLTPSSAFLLLGSAAAAGTLFALIFGSASTGLYGLLVALSCTAAAVQLWSAGGAFWPATGGLALLGFSATAVEKRYWGERPGHFVYRTLPAPYLLYGAFAWSALWYLHAFAPEAYLPAALAGLAFLLGVATIALHARALTVAGISVLVAAGMFWLAAGHETPPEASWRLCAYILLATALAGERFFAWRKPFPKIWPCWLMLVNAWGVCIAYNQEAASPEWRFAGIAFTALMFVGYAYAVRSGAAAMLSLASAVIATLPMVLKTVPAVTADPYHVATGLIAAYVALIVYWLVAERAAFVTLRRTRFQLPEAQATSAGVLLAALPALLGVLCVARIEPVHDFYLTLSWTVWALAIFGWALVTHQSWFRYMGLAVLGLALGRAFLMDVWKLEGLYRAGAMLVLGSALLGVGYGYTRWRASQQAPEGEEKHEEENPL